MKKNMLILAVFIGMFLVCGQGLSAEKSGGDEPGSLEKSLSRAAANLKKEPFLTKPEIYNRLVRVLTENPAVLGSAYATAPFPKGSKRMTFYYVHRRGKEDFGMRDNINYNFAESKRADWYRIPLKTLQPRWSEPYSGADNEGKDVMMKTYTLPVFDDNDELLFMLTADVPAGL